MFDKLVNSDGFNARMFSYFADMLRMADTAQKAKFFTYEEWFKEQLNKKKEIWTSELRGLIRTIPAFEETRQKILNHIKRAASS